MRCSECSSPAKVAVDGHPLCVEHYRMFEEAQSIRLRNILAYRNELVGQMEVGGGLPAGALGYRTPRPVFQTGPTTNHNIRIDRSVVGVINTGHIDRLRISLSEIQNRGDEATADALTK